MAKLAIFDTVILWESFIVGNSEQLSHSITVPNLNILVNIWMVLLSTNNRNREKSQRLKNSDAVQTFFRRMTRKKSLRENGRR